MNGASYQSAKLVQVQLPGGKSQLGSHQLADLNRESTCYLHGDRHHSFANHDLEASVSHSGNHICFRFASGLAFLLFATCCAVGQIHETNVYSGINRLLPDGNDVGIEDHRTNTSQIGELTQVRVSLKITGNYNGDVYAYLRHTSPASTNSHIAVLLNRPGRTDANAYGYPDSGFDIVLDDLATNDVHTYQSVLTPPSGTPLTGEWQPDARLTDPYLVTTTSTRWAFLSTLKGMTGAGEWMLFVADMDAGGTNLLVSWSLELTGKMLPDVTWLSPGAIVYGSPLTTNELSASANVSGTFAYSPPLGTVLNAGTGQTLSVIFTPDDTNQYSTASAAVPIDVQPRQLVVTALDTNKTYGVSLQIDSTQFEAQGLLGGENITNLTLSCDGLDAVASVGTYPIVPSNAEGNFNITNYSPIYQPGTLSVDPASLTCQVVDATRFYGQANPAFGATYSGFLNSDDAGSLEGSLAFDTVAVTNSPVGTYVVTASGLAATNYSIVFVDGSLAVQPAPLLIIAQEATRFYGQTNPPFAAIYSGLVNGETASVLDGTLIFDCQATTNSPVGPYDISPSGLTATNYLVAFSNAVLTINSSPSYCSLSSSTNMAAPGDSIVFTVSLSLEPPSELVPEGEVSFQIDGLDYGGPVTLDQGQGQLTATIAAPGLHTVTVAYVGDTNILGSTNALSPPQLVDTAPIATNLTMVRTVSGDSRIGINYLATNSQAADGGALTVQNVNPVTANGGTVMMTNGWIVYTPPDGNTNQDAFTFTVEDAFGVTSTGAITVNATPDVSAAARLKITAITNEICSLEIEGTPWGVYSLEAREDSFTTGGWHSLGIFTLDSTGWTTWLDSQSPVSPVKLYRVKFLDGIAVSTDISPLITDVSASTYSAPPGTTIDFDLKLTPSIANSPLPQGTLQCQVDGTNIGNLFALNNGEGLFSTAAIPWGQHVVSFVYGGDTSFPGFDVSLGKSVLIDSAPVAAPYNLTGSTSRGIKMLVSDLQTVASDPDGDPITIGLPSQTTAEGGSILMSDGWFYYTPPSGQLRQDGFNYLMRDSLGVTNFGAVNISPVAISDNFPAIQIIELATNTYRLQFSGVPWLGYTFQYASDSDGTNWLDLALCYADSQGLVTYDTTIPAGNGSILFRAVADDLGTSASPFQLDCWNNFVTITNNREMKVWSIRDLPTGWPDVPPVLAWNANCLIYGIKGFTGISPCNEFEVNLGQIPATLVTRRHAVVRGHSFGPNGLRTTNAPIGQRVWFLTASNAVVEMTIAACLVRSDFYNGQYYDYGLLIFTEDVPADIQPLSVMYLSDFGLYCYPNANVPYLVFGTEQGGNVGTEGDPVEPFVTNLWKGGDSGSPDFIISPDNKLVLISNRGGTGVSQQFAEDVDTLTLWAGLNPADYQLNWYDLSPWAP